MQPRCNARELGAGDHPGGPRAKACTYRGTPACPAGLSSAGKHPLGGHKPSAWHAHNEILQTQIECPGSAWPSQTLHVNKSTTHTIKKHPGGGSWLCHEAWTPINAPVSPQPCMPMGSLCRSKRKRVHGVNYTPCPPMAQVQPDIES